MRTFVEGPLIDGEVEIQNRLSFIAHEVWRVITLRGMVPEQAPDYMSEHYRAEALQVDAE